MRAPLPTLGDYPAIVRTGGRIRAQFVAFGVALVVIGLGSALFSYLAFFEVKLLVAEVAFAGLGAYFIAAPFISSVVVLPDSIEDRGVFITRRFLRSDIAGKKIFGRETGALIETVVIYPIARKSMVMKIEKSFPPNPTFNAWIDSLPNLADVTPWSTAYKRMQIWVWVIFYPTLIAFNLAGNLLCFGYGGSSLHVLRSTVTHYSPVNVHNHAPADEIRQGDNVVVTNVVSWPEKFPIGGIHRIEWKWYLDGKLISRSHACNMRFTRNPWTLDTEQDTTTRGAGNYRVETYIDGKNMNDSAFRVLPTPHPARHAARIDTQRKAWGVSAC